MAGCWEKICAEGSLGMYAHGSYRIIETEFHVNVMKSLLKTCRPWETLSDHLHSDIQTEIRNTLHLYHIRPSFVHQVYVNVVLF